MSNIKNDLSSKVKLYQYDIEQHKAIMKLLNNEEQELLESNASAETMRNFYERKNQEAKEFIQDVITVQKANLTDEYLYNAEDVVYLSASDEGTYYDKILIQLDEDVNFTILTPLMEEEKDLDLYYFLDNIEYTGEYWEDQYYDEEKDSYYVDEELVITQHKLFDISFDDILSDAQQHFMNCDFDNFKDKWENIIGSEKIAEIEKELTDQIEKANAIIDKTADRFYLENWQVKKLFTSLENYEEYTDLEQLANDTVEMFEQTELKNIPSDKLFDIMKGYRFEDFINTKMEDLFYDNIEKTINGDISIYNSKFQEIKYIPLSEDSKLSKLLYNAMHEEINNLDSSLNDYCITGLLSSETLPKSIENLVYEDLLKNGITSNIDKFCNKEFFNKLTKEQFDQLYENQKDLIPKLIEFLPDKFDNKQIMETYNDVDHFLARDTIIQRMALPEDVIKNTLNEINNKQDIRSNTFELSWEIQNNQNLSEETVTDIVKYMQKSQIGRGINICYTKDHEPVKEYLGHSDIFRQQNFNINNPVHKNFLEDVVNCKIGNIMVIRAIAERYNSNDDIMKALLQKRPLYNEYKAKVETLNYAETIAEDMALQPEFYDKMSSEIFTDIVNKSGKRSLSNDDRYVENTDNIDKLEYNESQCKTEYFSYGLGDMPGPGSFDNSGGEKRYYYNDYLLFTEQGFMNSDPPHSKWARDAYTDYSKCLSDENFQEYCEKHMNAISQVISNEEHECDSFKDFSNRVEQFETVINEVLDNKIDRFSNMNDNLENINNDFNLSER